MNPTKQEMISKIYEKIADKTLDLWCKIKSLAYKKNLIIAYVFTAWWQKHWRILWDDYKDTLYIEHIWYGWNVSEKDIKKVIWHPVYIGDMLDWLSNEYTKRKFIDAKEILWLRTYKRKPIEAQSIETIEYIYSLLT